MAGCTVLGAVDPDEYRSGRRYRVGCRDPVDHRDRTVGVMGGGGAHRAEQSALERTVTPAAEHQHVRVRGALDQRRNDQVEGHLGGDGKSVAGCDGSCQTGGFGQGALTVVTQPLGVGFRQQRTGAVPCLDPHRGENVQPAMT